jgi:hypothetical protein
MQPNSTKTRFEASLSDMVVDTNTISKERAEKIFTFFKNNQLFQWRNCSNDCEDRANAICILLDQWGIPNYKAWVFAGAYLKKKEGSLVNFWNYHVAAVLPVTEGEERVFYVIDPGTGQQLNTVEDWAEKVTSIARSYYLIKESSYYIFAAGKIDKHNWYRRNRRNYNWTLQGLAGINGVSKKGQAALVFRKSKLGRVTSQFRSLRYNKPLL